MYNIPVQALTLEKKTIYHVGPNPRVVGRIR